MRLGRVPARLWLVLAATLLTPSCTAAFGAFAGDALQIPIIEPSPPQAPTETPKRVELELAHVFHHGTHKYPNLHRRMDINKKQCKGLKDLSGDSPRLESLVPYSVSVDTINIQRLADRSRQRLDDLQAEAHWYGAAPVLPLSDWTVDTIPAPNASDKDTVLTFARLAANAYVCEDGTWLDVGKKFNYTDDFGWLKDGLRGHIFTDKENGTVVVSIKGTTPAVFDGDGSTTKDKANDNLFFGCCCGAGGPYLHRVVCNCMTESMVCNSTCLVKELHAKDRYWAAAQELYENVTSLYPHAEIWLTGHSLGGAIASMLGMQYGHVVFGFEAPGDALPASRLRLPTPPGYNFGKDGKRATSGAYHFGHNADPVFLGTCGTFGTFCTLGGYALESACHTGHTCMYDAKKLLGWSESMLHHSIVKVYHSLYEPFDLPKCEVVRNCQDCVDWTFYKSNGSETTTTTQVTTTSTSSYTRTRTQTCQTPGWWGCLDETTTDTGTHTKTSDGATTTSTSTSTCTTPGWFGCLDPTPTTTTMTTTSTTSSTTTTLTSTSTCKTPGWFGCNDPTTTSKDSSPTATPGPTITTVPPTTTASPPKSSTSSTTSSTTCTSPGVLWGCRDKPKATASGSWTEQYKRWHVENDLPRY